MINLFKKLFGPSVDYKNLVENGAIIIDVRTRGEFNSGHIPGSENIPLSEIPKSIKQLKKWNKPIILVCASGMRSASAKSLLAGNDFELYNGGGWMSLFNKLEK